MKFVKMLGLMAAAALALLAVMGAGTASADVICTENVDPCPAAKKITTIDATITSGSSAALENTSNSTFATCTEGTVHGDITAQGSGVNPSGPITSLTWGATPKCSTTVDTVKLGTLELRTEGGIAEIWAKEAEVTLSVFGVSCTYGAKTGTTLGRFTTGAGAKLDINAVVNKTAGGFLCPETARWTGEYTVTNHTSVFVTNA